MNLRLSVAEPANISSDPQKQEQEQEKAQETEFRTVFATLRERYRTAETVDVAMGGSLIDDGADGIIEDLGLHAISSTILSADPENKARSALLDLIRIKLNDYSEGTDQYAIAKDIDFALRNISTEAERAEVFRYLCRLTPDRSLREDLIKLWYS